MINFVPAPIAAPVSAFTTLLVVELGLVVFGLIVGLTVLVPVVVLVAGVVVVLFVIVGVVLDVSVVFGVKVVLGVEDVLVVREGLVAGFVNTEVNGRPPLPAGALEPPEDVREDAPLSEIKGVFSTPRMTLPSGARSSPLASGICLLDVRFFRIAIFYPVFFTCEVRPAILVIGVNFASLPKVFAGATRVVGAAF
jgi:hypothetical protein